MAISYPLSLPSTLGFAEMQITPHSVVGVSVSPFTGEQQVQAMQGEWWEGNFSLPNEMSRADAEAWIGFLVSLNGREGTFLAGDPLGATARGTATGTPLVKGASQTGKTLLTDGWTSGVTGILKAGDWIQLGTGSSTHLHKVVADANSDGSGNATLEIWPRLRSSPGDNDAITKASCKGLWRLTIAGVGWTINDVRIGGIVVPCMEAI